MIELKKSESCYALRCTLVRLKPNDVASTLWTPRLDQVCQKAVFKKSSFLQFFGSDRENFGEIFPFLGQKSTFLTQSSRANFECHSKALHPWGCSVTQVLALETKTHTFGFSSLSLSSKLGSTVFWRN